METALLVTRRVRADVRRHRPARLSVSQFRGLAYLHAHPDASLSVVADYLGLTPPATSKLVEELVRRKLVTRRTAPSDRRRAMLRLTAKGQASLRSAFDATQAGLARLLTTLAPSERAAVVSAMELVRAAVAPASESGVDVHD
jgi:DNA-binding MarR family transcriptional regulator